MEKETLNRLPRLQRLQVPLLACGPEGIDETTENVAAVDVAAGWLLDERDCVERAHADLSEDSVYLLKLLRCAVDWCRHVAEAASVECELRRRLVAACYPAFWLAEWCQIARRRHAAPLVLQSLVFEVCLLPFGCGCFGRCGTLAHRILERIRNGLFVLAELHWLQHLFF